MQIAAYTNLDWWALLPQINITLDRDMSRMGYFDGEIDAVSLLFSFLCFNLCFTVGK